MGLLLYWRLRTASSSATPTWNTRLLTGQRSVDLPWPVRARASQQVTTPWHQREALGHTLSALWQERAVVARHTSPTWHTRTLIDTDLDVAYADRNLAGQEVSSSWQERQAVAADEQTRWRAYDLSPPPGPPLTPAGSPSHVVAKETVQQAAEVVPDHIEDDSRQTGERAPTIMNSEERQAANRGVVSGDGS